MSCEDRKTFWFLATLGWTLNIVLFLPSFVNGTLEGTLERCCNEGSSWGANNTNCAGPPTPLRGISADDRYACHVALYICCIKIHRYLNCEKGKQTALSGRLCSLLATAGGEAHKDCCDGCNLGLKASQRSLPCILNSVAAFGSPWDEAYSECCINAASRQGQIPTTYVDPCQAGTHNCNPNTETCVSTADGFQCVEKRAGRCAPGYIFNAEKQACDDVDECSISVCPPDHICINIIGSFRCMQRSPAINCPPGFRKNPAINSCLDIDECAEGIHDCDPVQELCLNSHGGYQCQPKSGKSKDCPAGMKWNTPLAVCEDVDECETDKHTCSLESQVCENTVGSYRCVSKGPTCPHGYRPNVVTNECVDINECIENADDCDRTRQDCINTPGGFQCHSKPPVPRCGIGYKSEDGLCRDINECEELQPCAPDQTCENTIGSYRCQCQQGFSFDNITKHCKDVNECQLKFDTCLENQRCDNTMGSYTCVRSGCGTGYTLNAQINECEDDDECILGSHNCGSGFVCRNTRGSFRCDRVRCPVGQKLLADGTCQSVTCDVGMEGDSVGNCIDINECTTGRHTCKVNQRCINSIGSYRCQNLINCGPGYELNEYGTNCVDIDECAQRIHECDAGQECRNVPGGYTCECPTGFSLNSERQCEDIDECTRYFGQVCSITSECQNTPGSYICNCKEGFQRAGDSRNCIDIDECAESPNICQHSCINVWGSYQCSCQPGYTLAPDRRSCQDIDECTLWEGRGSLCIGNCVNEPGSYKCECPEGYRLQGDQRTCQDINECEEQSTCKGSNEVCLNTRGSFKCNIIDCPSNYVRDREHRNRCKKPSVECAKDDSVCRNEPMSYSYNYLTFVSNIRLPLSGQIDLFTMRGPRFSFTTVQFSLDLKDVRAPQGVIPATRDYFHLRNTAFNEAMISLVKSIQGPQEIELELLMKMYHNGLFGGNAVAKIFIFVTQNEF